jgi:transcriptional regulator with XRE-family HTH domain
MKLPNESDALYVQRVANTLGLSHEQLGSLVGRSQPAISQIVAGRRVEVDPLLIHRLDELLAAHLAVRSVNSDDAPLEFCAYLDREYGLGHLSLDEVAAHIPVCPECMSAVLYEFI